MIHKILYSLFISLVLMIAIFLLLYYLIKLDNIQDIIYFTGGILQIFGVFVVFWGLILIYYDIQGKDRPWTLIKRRINLILQKLGIKKIEKKIGGSIAEVSSTAHGHHVRKAASINTIDELYGYVEEEIKNIRNEIREMEERLSEIIRSKLQRESEKLIKEDKFIKSLLEKISIGNIRLELIGIFCLLLGIILTTFNFYIAKFICM